MEKGTYIKKTLKGYLSVVGFFSFFGEEANENSSILIYVENIFQDIKKHIS